MDSLADLWARSGKKNQRLYQGGTGDIVKELEAWVGRRKAHNNVYMDVTWKMFDVMDSLQQLSNQPSGVQEEHVLGMVATQMGNLDRSRNLEQEKERETLLADFFLASLRNRGIRWPQMPRTEKTQADADVCAFLGTVDQGFNPQMELEILEDSTRITQWQAELRERDAIRAQEIANDPIPGVNTHPIGLVGARFRQEVGRDPTISTRQALTNAAHGIMIPDAVDFAMGGSSTNTTSTPSATREATRATGENAPTTDYAAVYIADMLGNINIATDPSSITVANLPDSMNTAAASSSSNAPAAPDITYVALEASSSTPANTSVNTNITAVTETGTNDQTLPGTDGQDEVSKTTKAKKKREGRKRAKARAKEAATEAGDSVGNDDDDDGDVPDLMDD
ncbi:hypothetical protein HO173_006574 [Letharia columbiana]|uniref:Uncharacterized protein n=1 Tax=Letharia columbiana TaxID=112416 RepID=A0A8H6FVB8_9LECA|nr:uncharacterized protein HO173_006574 [Letharia columbiana]KAF6235378.1 hypothetical protein HO173_006574 [Letharia columbiana]